LKGRDLSPWLAVEKRLQSAGDGVAIANAPAAMLKRRQHQAQACDDEPEAEPCGKRLEKN